MLNASKDTEELEYPLFKQLLIAMFKKDQIEVAEFSRNYNQLTDSERVAQNEVLSNKCMERALRALEILAEIGTPSVSKIGKEGSQALSVVALHSTLRTMETVLAGFEKSYTDDPSNTFQGAIPSLRDRILVLKHNKQLYGTQWMPDTTGKPFLFPVKDFNKVNQRRAIYGLEPLNRPIDLSKPNASKTVRERAVIGDQKEPTELEYLDFAQES